MRISMFLFLTECENLSTIKARRYDIAGDPVNANVYDDSPTEMSLYDACAFQFCNFIDIFAMEHWLLNVSPAKHCCCMNARPSTFFFRSQISLADKFHFGTYRRQQCDIHYFCQIYAKFSFNQKSTRIHKLQILDRSINI